MLSNIFGSITLAIYCGICGLFLYYIITIAQHIDIEALFIVSVLGGLGIFGLALLSIASVIFIVLSSGVFVAAALFIMIFLSKLKGKIDMPIHWFGLLINLALIISLILSVIASILHPSALIFLFPLSIRFLYFLFAILEEKQKSSTPRQEDKALE